MSQLVRVAKCIKSKNGIHHWFLFPARTPWGKVLTTPIHKFRIAHRYRTEISDLYAIFLLTQGSNWGFSEFLTCSRRTIERIWWYSQGCESSSFQLFPLVWKFSCAKISAFSFIFSLFLAFNPDFTVFFLVFCMKPLTPLYSTWTHFLSIHFRVRYR